MNFTESNTVEALVRDLLCGPRPVRPETVRELPSSYVTSGLARRGVGWNFVPAAALPRQPQDVFVERYARDALIRLNPSIAAQPQRADEVIYKLRAIVLAVRSDGLVRTNEEFTAWLRGERSMPFGPNHEHVTVRLIDYEDLACNQYVATTQYTFRAGPVERRADLVLLVNGFPLVLVEAKTPVRKAVSWVDGALQVHDDYEHNVPELFAPNVFSVATEGKELRYGSIHMPVELWGPWRPDEARIGGGLLDIRQAINGLLRPQVLLDILANFTLFATDQKKRRLKIVCRYQQYDAANRIVDRVLAGYPKKGLIWHFQGSGKSLLMVFAAQKLRMQPGLLNPTVIIAVDRIDLDAQISATFHASDIPNLVKAETREELERLLRYDTRKIIITTIFKFGEAEGVLNDRANIVVMVDEAHRTQEGDLGLRMRAALPNAFFFGLTGTPINKRDRNTFGTFGAPEDSHGYMSRYSFDESIRDGATLPLRFEPRLVELHIDKAAIDEAYRDLTGGLSDLDKETLARAAARMSVLVKVPERIDRICADIAHHYQEKVEPNGFKAMVVTYDQESCLLYKAQLDRWLPPEASDVVISVSGKEREDERYKPYKRDRDAEEKLLDRFRDPNDPLQILVVTAKLLTGFDAPILQAMYLDKPLRDHTLLQAICRTNRTYGDKKSCGLIVDYLGVFDDVAASLEFDEEGFQQVVANIQGLKNQLPESMAKCLGYFDGVDRTLIGYEGLLAAQECLPNNDVRDAFAADYNALSSIWEMLSPDPVLVPHETDYRWLSQVYVSVQPTSGTGALLWHALGAKTIELIHQNVHVEAVRDDLEDIVLDADLTEALLTAPDPDKKAREVEIKVVARLRQHMGNPRFRALSERLESLKERHEAGQLHSVEFLKQLLDIARDLLEAEKETPPAEDEDRGKAALTELFEQVKTADTPIIVERLVAKIDEIVRLVRFPGWQTTTAGEREVRKALRKTLFDVKLHQDAELFDKAYGYIKQYY
ncbi:MAG: HsdR family type I site-specific deoxyribonuclease [Caldilineaceae bacterium]